MSHPLIFIGSPMSVLNLSAPVCDRIGAGHSYAVVAVSECVNKVHMDTTLRHATGAGE